LNLGALIVQNMPKTPAPKGVRLRAFVKEFGEKIFSTDGDILLCRVCEKSVNFEKRYFVTQHCDSGVHKRNVEKALGTSSTKSAPQTIGECLVDKDNEFTMDLCNALIASDIPMHKIENHTFRTFLEKYTKKSIPSRSSLRKYVDRNYQLTLAKIRESVGDKNIWISIDETTDSMGRYVANTIIGTLEPESQSRIFLLNSEWLEKTNASTISQALTNALCILWPEGIKHDRVILFVTDAAAYMRKASTALQVLFPNMVHLTCAVHGLHRVAEEVRSLFVSVDCLISNGKKVFLKAPSRVQAFKEKNPEVPLPPAPVVTRWGTWVNAALYYAHHLESFREVIEDFSEDDAASIRATRKCLEDPELRNELAYISAHCSTLPTTITKLEEANLSVSASFELLNHEIARLKSMPGQKGNKIKTKVDLVFGRNKGLETLQEIARVLEGESGIDLRISPHLVASYKYAPLTSVDVERSFSRLKNILADNRLSFSFENLCKHLVINCNFK
jgi:hypothetical protein